MVLNRKNREIDARIAQLMYNLNLHPKTPVLGTQAFTINCS
ncbi:hypothetical protein [Kamptonema sp. UHCC 0994]|nr:hypothetical protein [Kamptonema sp. UHCC 0994]MDF0551915.1 hypothetical protein [Kamptonema sp. UHCC 0994]